MSLRQAVATPFRQRGVASMSESEFLVELSLNRRWFSPDQAKRLVDVAATEGLLVRQDSEVVVSFDATSVDVPEEFEPDEKILQQRTTFERILDTIIDSDIEKQTAVADINRLQSNLGITVEAAAAVYAQQNGVDVSTLATHAREELLRD